MDKRPNLLVSLFRGGRLALHLSYAVALAIFYPHLAQSRRRRILKTQSRQLLSILGIGIRAEGEMPVRRESGFMIAANHVSWLDVFVLNTIYPSRFIAKAEVRSWPLIGWLCKRSNTIFIERAIRQDAASVNQHVSSLLKQGICVGIFPEANTTDGKQVGHFHSALIQSVIDADSMLCPIALCYQNENGTQSSAAAFPGDMTLLQSIWQILRSPRFDALVVFAPALAAAGGNRRVLARAAQEAVSQSLEHVAGVQHLPDQKAVSAMPPTPFPAQATDGSLALALSSQPPT